MLNSIPTTKAATSMATPTVRRLQLGNEMRHLREDAGQTQDMLGKAIGWTQTRVTRFENGEADVSVGDLREMCRVLGLDEDSDPERLAFLMELRKNNNQRGRWGGYRRIYPERFRMYVDLEEDAERIAVEEVEICPGLVQCESYARALMEELAHNDPTFDIEERLTARLARQRILDRANPPDLRVLMSESCVARQRASPSVMREQLDHLIKLSSREHIQIQIMPFRSPSARYAVSQRATLLHIPTAGISSSLEFVYIEGIHDSQYLDDKATTALYERRFARLSAAALSPQESRAWLRAAINTW